PRGFWPKWQHDHVQVAYILSAFKGETRQTPKIKNYAEAVRFIRAISESPSWARTFVADEVLGVAVADSRAPAEMRQELACAAIRLQRTHDTIPMLHSLLLHKDDAKDPVIPQLIWLAYEPKLATAAKSELSWLKGNVSGNPLLSDFILPRAMRRLAATDKAENLAQCLEFVGELKDNAARTQALIGLVTALDRRTLDAPGAWPTPHERLP